MKAKAKHFPQELFRFPCLFSFSAGERAGRERSGADFSAVDANGLHWAASREASVASHEQAKQGKPQGNRQRAERSEARLSAPAEPSPAKERRKKGKQTQK